MSHLAGGALLVRLVLRRDRVRLIVWISAFTALLAMMASAVDDLVATEEALIAFVQIYAVNPVFRLFGLASGATLGAFLITRVHMLFAVGIVLMSVFGVVRNTRREEELGRAALLGSTAVGRHAPLVAALGVTIAADLLIALLLTAVLVAFGHPIAGAIAAGAAIGFLGVAFAGVAAVCAQLAQSARAASGLVVAFFGVSFLLAGLGNMLGTAVQGGLVVESAWLSWISPFGWSQQVRPFGGNEWWVLGLLVVFAVASVTVAFLLRSRRDLGQGILPQRLGPARAPAALLSSFGLAWRLQRGLLLGWLIAFIILGLVYGATSSAVESLIEELGGPAQEIFGAADVIIDSYFGVILGFLAVLATAYLVQALSRMRAEEAHGALEALLATGLSRPRWMAGQIASALLGGLLVFLAGALATALAASLLLGDAAHWFWEILVLAGQQLPAVFVVAAATVLAFGLLPRFAVAGSWGAFTVALVLGPMFGSMLGLPDPWLSLSPYSHVPAVIGETISPVPLVVLCVVAIGLVAGGAAAFTRRDVLAG